MLLFSQSVCKSTNRPTLPKKYVILFLKQKQSFFASGDTTPTVARVKKSKRKITRKTSRLEKQDRNRLFIPRCYEVLMPKEAN